MSSRTTRLVGTLVLACAAGPLLAAPALAATSESASSAGYFNVAGPQDTGTPVGTPPNIGTEIDGVAAGDLGVSGSQGQEQKVSFLLFPGAGLEPGASVTSASLTVPLSTSEGNLVFGQAPEKVRVCAVGDEGFGGEDGASLMVAPTRKCDVFSAPGKASPDGAAYVFDVTGLAKLWAEQNDGLALTVAADATPFQVVFAPGDQARLTYDATAPAGSDAGSGSSGGSTGGDAGGTDTGASTGGSGTADLGSGFDSGVMPAGDLLAPDDLGAGTSGDVPLTAPLEAAPAAPAEEEVAIALAPEAAAPDILAAPAAQEGVVREPTLTPGATFWVGLAALAGLLALVSLVLGDTEVPRKTGGSTSRLSLALQARQQPGAAGRPGLGLGRS